MKKIFLSRILFYITIFLLMTELPASADQAAWVLKADADKAVQMIDPGIEIRTFCQPCGETSWTSVIVNQVELKNSSGQYFQVFINGQGVDLAYCYINKDGKWKNIAIILGLDVSGVSEFIIDEGTPGSSIHKTAIMWDDELNRVYGLLRSKLKPEAQKALKNSQLAWIKYRDLEFENIDNIYSNFQGTMYSPMRIDHRNQLIKQRVTELQSYLDLFDNY
ncbi:Lysozyme inhibitor N-terminal domain-containing protein [Desulfonema limicola]|uniref:Lysozyme inhibitor N-terminal domain-containing protein n=1 Tax=Desulfonema limicola TaxID=45656 RepID=A0A975B6E2_9BACT|nr:lysozyme inhibitor LprI family protein [Desulfonema limicola]QTA79627.1 Lysozyme inhibitor N-terminal domain-containing protein [Desulfonema limicola]